MLNNVIKATKAHYAALQHRPSADRIPLHYSVYSGYEQLANGTIQVKAPNNARRKAELTKLLNRLQAMYPEANEIECSYKK